MKYNVVQYFYQVFKKYGVIFLFSGISLFCMASLWTFSATDASWFYHTNAMHNYKNIFGFFGAHCAAWLIYFFGHAAFLVPFIILYFIVCYYGMYITKKMKYIAEWDRTVGVIAGFLSTILFCQVYHVVSYDFTYPGGVFGNYLIKQFFASFDDVGQKVIVCFLLLFSLVLITRCSYISLLKNISQYLKYIFNPEKLPARIILQTYKIIALVVTGSVWGCRKIFDLVTGNVLKHLTTSIVEFEYEKNVDQDIDQIVQDLFWNDYIDTPKSAAFTPTKTDQNFQNQVDTENDATHTISDAENMLAQSGTKMIDVEMITRRKKPDYQLPFLSMQKTEQKVMLEQQDALALQAKLLEEKLEQFDIKGAVVAMHAGPVVTLFEYQPDIKVKVSRILSLEDDLAMALKALSIRIIAPIPGRSVVGFEVANKDRHNVAFAAILDSSSFKKFNGSLPMIFGQDTLGNHVVADLAKMPHLLIAGSTGSGKSVALNAMLVSLLCALRPDQLKLIIIDPKRLEFAAYDGIAHLIFPIVTETKKAIPILKWVVQTMEDRYKIMAKHGVRNLLDYQIAAKTNKEMEPMPLIVVIIDELADLMMTAGKAVEDSIARIAQMARAAGIHMIIATQRPSVDVITGMIKVNFPNRVAFKVTSKIDSRTILDVAGAEKLLGRGDMLFLDASKSNLIRVHGAYVSDEEIHGVVSQIKQQQIVQYLDLFEKFGQYEDDEISDEDDELYQEVLILLKDLDEVSISMLQRRFRIGYNRSARIVSILESKGLIMSMEGGKTRRVIK